MIRVTAQRIGIIALTSFLFSTAVQASNPPATTIPVSSERRLSFNEDWRFYKADAKGAEDPRFDDSQWKKLKLPHDWAIEGPFDPKLNPHTGALPISGTGWYRKSFFLPDCCEGPLFHNCVRWSDVECNRLDKRARVGAPSLWLLQFCIRRDAIFALRRRNKCAFRSLDAGGALFALVSRGRYLSQRLAGCNWTGACRGVGNLHHDSGSF